MLVSFPVSIFSHGSFFLFFPCNVVVDSTIHPDTGEAVFLPFRMSCFVPTNMVLVAGMLLPNPSVCFTIAFLMFVLHELSFLI